LFLFGSLQQILKHIHVVKGVQVGDVHALREVVECIEHLFVLPRVDIILQRCQHTLQYFGGKILIIFRDGHSQADIEVSLKRYPSDNLC